MNITINSQAYETFESLAKAQGKTVQEYLEDIAISMELDDAEREFDETGLHITHEEAKKWLLTPKAKAPECHK